jgi:hypothetical protein
MMNLLLLAVIPLTASAAPLEDAFDAASARAALTVPCERVADIRLDRPGIVRGAVVYGFSAKVFDVTKEHQGWRVVRDEAVFGKRFGTMDSGVPEARYQELVKAVNTPEFFAMGPRYAAPAGGELYVVTVACADGRSKSVAVTGPAAPAAFQNAVEAIMRLAASLFWVS